MLRDLTLDFSCLETEGWGGCICQIRKGIVIGLQCQQARGFVHGAALWLLFTRSFTGVARYGLTASQSTYFAAPGRNVAYEGVGD